MTRSPSSSWWIRMRRPAASESPRPCSRRPAPDGGRRCVRGVVGPGQALVVVGGQVVWRGQQRDHPPEALDAQPNDLLGAAHPPVVDREPAGALADCEVVPDDPGEVAGRDAAAHLPFMRQDISRATWTVAATSCTRTNPAPATRAAATVASDPSRRSATGAGPSPDEARTPRKRLRLVPTATPAHPAAAAAVTSSSRWCSSERLCATVLPKPMPGRPRPRPRRRPEPGGPG